MTRYEGPNRALTNRMATTHRDEELLRAVRSTELLRAVRSTNIRASDFDTGPSPARACVLGLVLFWLIVLLAIVYSHRVSAEINLTPICANATSVGKTSCSGSTVFALPQGNIVKSGGVWLRYDLLASISPVLYCPDDKTINANADPLATVCPSATSRAASAWITTTTPPPNVSGSFPLSWILPTQRVDGSLLTDLKSTRIYSAANGSALTLLKEVLITDPSPTSLQLAGYSNGRYDFALTAVTLTGEESARSSVVTITVTISRAPASPIWR